MATTELDKIRNIGIMAHIDAEKLLLQKGFYITPVIFIEWEKSMMVMQLWIGWTKRKREE